MREDVTPTLGTLADSLWDFVPCSPYAQLLPCRQDMHTHITSSPAPSGRTTRELDDGHSNDFL